MNAESVRKNPAAIYVWLPAILSIFAVLFRERCLEIFTEFLTKRARGQITESPSWLGTIDTISIILVVISIVAVIISGILTKGWAIYPSWVRILLPALGAASILFGFLLV